jgi:hypothetical protein
MSDAASETSASPASPPPPFVESDAGRTELPYDEGKVPLYVALVWVAFIVAYFVGVLTLVLPDLRAWMGR